MSILLLLIFISVSYLIVQGGAIALEMTGLEKSMARFQSLSAFSGTGFTTREAETVVNHPLRRKIITILMILGNAGLVSVIAAFVLSLRSTSYFRPSLNLLLIGIALFFLYRLAVSEKVSGKLNDRIEKTLVERFHLGKDQVEELLQQAEGYGAARVLIGKESPMIGLSLSKSGLTREEIMVLSIERDSRIIPVPRAQNKIREGDRLILFGKLENVRKLF
jgi:hypothetical protein